MRGVIQKLLAMGINMTYNIQEKTKKILRDWKAQGLKKEGWGRVLVF